MLSKTCEYAIRALVYIAQMSKNGDRVGIKAIAKGIDSPEYFIAKILQNLGKKGFVHSIKGPNGGFFLKEKDWNTSLAEIVLEIDGDKIFTGCMLGLKYCSEEHPCPVHDQFKHVKEDYTRLLEESRISDMVNGLDEKLTFLRR